MKVNLHQHYLTKSQVFFNELMEKERDNYLNNEAYQRDSNKSTYRNGCYKRDYTTKIGTLTLRVPKTRDEKFFIVLVSLHKILALTVIFVISVQ